MHNKFIVLFICLMTCISARAQEKIVATAKNGLSPSLYIKEKFGEQATNNFIYAHLINDGPSEDMAIILGYVQYQKRYWFSGELQGYPVLYGNYFGAVSTSAGINIFRWKNNTKMLIRSFETNAGSFLPGGFITEYRMKIPTIANINAGIAIRAGYANQLGGYGSISVPNNYSINKLNALELGVGPQINIFRHIKFSYREHGSDLQRSCFFSIRSLVTFFPYFNYSYERVTSPYLQYNAPFDSTTVPLPYMVFRTQIDGRFQYMNRLDWGLAWRAGVMTNAFFNERFFYGGIGLFLGWGKQRQYKSPKEH